MKIAICTGRIEKMWLEKGYCPNCKKQRYFIREMVEWYGLYDTCLRCGDKWFEGKMMARPFCRGWRKMQIEKAKKWYRCINIRRIKK